jgi:hypothetical protein
LAQDESAIFFNFPWVCAFFYARIRSRPICGLFVRFEYFESTDVSLRLVPIADER